MAALNCRNGRMWHNSYSPFNLILSDRATRAESWGCNRSRVLSILWLPVTLAGLLALRVPRTSWAIKEQKDSSENQMLHQS